MFYSRFIFFLRLIFVALIFAVLTGCSSTHFSDIQGSDIEYDGTVGSKVLHTALTQIGTKYSFGKASPSTGFDCSGLIYWAYGKNGYKVPRDTKSQSVAGKKVSKWAARQGDIIVFKVGRRLHTGLIADRGRFVHAPSTGKRVRLESYNSDYWKNKLVSIRRMF